VDLSTMVKRWVNPMHVRKYSLRHRNGVGWVLQDKDWLCPWNTAAMLKQVRPTTSELLPCSLLMVHPQNVQLHNVQLQNVHLPSVQSQNVQVTKPPGYQTSILQNVQITEHPDYKTSSFCKF
jgi:hypothetical protein